MAAMEDFVDVTKTDTPTADVLVTGKALSSPLDDFNQLKFLDKPNSAMNRETLPQTLEDCVGYLKALPLVQPNVDQKDPLTIADMINVLTLPDAEKILEQAIGFTAESQFTLSPAEYRRQQRAVYDHKAEPMLSLVARARKATVHKQAPLTLGKLLLQ